MHAAGFTLACRSIKRQFICLPMKCAVLCMDATSEEGHLNLERTSKQKLTAVKWSVLLILSSLVQTICPPQAFCLRLHTLIPPDSFIPLHTSCRYLQATVRQCCQVESATQTRVICPPRAFRLLGVVPIFSSLVPNTVELTEMRLSSTHMCHIQL